MELVIESESDIEFVVQMTVASACAVRVVGKSEDVQIELEPGVCRPDSLRVVPTCASSSGPGLGRSVDAGAGGNGRGDRTGESRFRLALQSAAPAQSQGERQSRQPPTGELSEHERALRLWRKR